MSDLERCGPASQNNQCLTQGQAFQSYLQSNKMVWSVIGDEEMEGFGPHFSQTASSLSYLHQAFRVKVGYRYGVDSELTTIGH